MYNLEFLTNVGTPTQREQYRTKLEKPFETQARYIGNGTYQICGIVSNDTAELFDAFIGLQLCVDKKVTYTDEEIFEED